MNLVLSLRSGIKESLTHFHGKHANSHEDDESAMQPFTPASIAELYDCSSEANPLRKDSLDSWRVQMLKVVWFDGSRVTSWLHMSLLLIVDSLPKTPAKIPIMATAPDPIARPVLLPAADAAVPPAPSTVAEVLKILITLIRPVRSFALAWALPLINSQLHWVIWIALETSSTEGTAPSLANRTVCGSC